MPDPAVRLSDEFVSSQEQTAAELENRAAQQDREGKAVDAQKTRGFARVIRTTLEQAKQTSGYVPTPPPAAANPVERAFGIGPEQRLNPSELPIPTETFTADDVTGLAGFLSRARADASLQRAILADSSRGPATPEQLARIKDSAERAGLNPATLIDDVSNLLARYGSTVPVSKLGMASLLYLAIHGKHLARAGR